MRANSKIALGLIVLGVVAMGAWRLVEPFLAQREQTRVSDSAEVKGQVNIAVDGWVGYFPLCSPEMKRRMRRAGYLLNCVDDAADYSARFEGLASGRYTFAVATVDSYLYHGAKTRFPGPIVAVIDESKGGDAIVARAAKIDSLEALKTATDFKIVYTPDSPSHHLLKSVISHFDVASLRNSANHIHAQGSEQAYKVLKAGKADVAVLWEPDVSKALADGGYVRLLGTEETKQLIVDVLLASRQAAKNEPQLVSALLQAYFNTLKFYATNADVLAADLVAHYDLGRGQIASMLQGVAWANLSDNAETWYAVAGEGLAREALVASIESAAEILRDNGDFNENPIPNRDPYRLLNSQFVAELYRVLGESGGWPDGAKKAAEHTFKALSDREWQLLREVGSLKARNIAFASGTAELTDSGRRTIDQLVRDLQHYPTFRVEVRGHTGVRGDPAVNMLLSQQRAQAVARYLESQPGIEGNRVRAVGFGGQRPLPRGASESARAYNYRLPRVELVLVRENW